MVWQFKFVNELTRFTHSTPLKICFIVQTPQIGIKGKMGEKSQNNKIFKTKNYPEQQKMSAFVVKSVH